MRIHNQTKQELLPLKSWTPGAFGGQCEPPSLSSVTQFSQMVAGAGPPQHARGFSLGSSLMCGPRHCRGNLALAR